VSNATIRCAKSNQTVTTKKNNTEIFTGEEIVESCPSQAV